MLLSLHALHADASQRGMPVQACTGGCLFRQLGVGAHPAVRLEAGRSGPRGCDARLPGRQRQLLRRDHVRAARGDADVPRVALLLVGRLGLRERAGGDGDRSGCGGSAGGWCRGG